MRRVATKTTESQAQQHNNTATTASADQSVSDQIDALDITSLREIAVSSCGERFLEGECVQERMTETSGMG